jgi:autotransporter-associated beta strand protein
VLTNSSSQPNTVSATLRARGTNTTNTLNLNGDGDGLLTVSGAVRNQSGERFTTVQKNGASTVLLSNGNNDYTRATTLNSGTLVLNGSLTATSLVNVNGGTLAGAGSIWSGATVTATGGTIAPGDSTSSDTTASLATGPISLTSPVAFNVEIGGTSFTFGGVEEYDQLAVTGTVALGNATLGASLINSFTLGANQFFTIIDNDDVDAVTGTFAGLAQGDVVLSNNGYDLLVSYTGTSTSSVGGNDVVLYTTLIPEPASAFAVATLGLGLIVRRRRT